VPQPPTVARSSTAITGWEFTSWAFTRRVQQAGLVASMGSIGDCFDNAVIESFWARMQVELLNRKTWKTTVELANAIFEYLEIFHNRSVATARWGCLPRSSMRSSITSTIQ
jgi:putative transposase